VLTRGSLLVDTSEPIVVLFSCGTFMGIIAEVDCPDELPIPGVVAPGGVPFSPDGEVSPGV
jgi:hypothetical protein